MQEENSEQRNKYSEDIAGLCYFDDRFARNCLKDNKAAVARIINTILEKDDLIIESYETQSDIISVDRRSIMIDIHAVDSKGKQYAIELEATVSGAVPQRARYIGSMIDSRVLNKSENFKDLPENYVIFITEHDIFKNKQKAVHRFDRYDISDNTPLNDGSHIIYVNGEYTGDDDIGKLIHNLLCKDPDQMYYDELAEPARFYKKTEEGEKIMSGAFERVREEGRKEGHEEGRREGVYESVITLLKKGIIKIDMVSQLYPVLTETDITAIKKELRLN